MEFSKKLFRKDLTCVNGKKIKAANLKPTMAIELSNGLLFYIDDVDKEFKNNKVSKLYNEDCEDNDIDPKHSIVTLYSIDDMLLTKNNPWSEITNIPGDFEFVTYEIFPVGYFKNDKKVDPLFNVISVKQLSIEKL